MARSIYSGTGSRTDVDSGVSFFSVQWRGSIDPAIVFVVSVALGEVPQIIQISSVGAYLCHFVDRTRIFFQATAVNACDCFQNGYCRLWLQ